MDIDAFVNTVGKAMTLAATAIALRFGGGLTEVILMQGLGGISMLLVAAIAALRLDISVKIPVMKLLHELLRRGAPIAAFSIVIASQPFVEVLMLSAFTSPAVVGWYGAYRTIFGIVASPAIILVAATFPELSRASRSLPDLRRTIDATGRVLFIAAAFTSSALYLFADHLVAIIYGYGRFEQTASILRVSAVFVPLLFFGYVLASAMIAIGKNKAMAIISVVKIVLLCGFELAADWLLAAAVWKWSHCACDHSRCDGDTDEHRMLDVASKKRSWINHNTQFVSSLHCLALHGRAAITAAAAWAILSRSALLSVVCSDSHGDPARSAERSKARNGGRAQESVCTRCYEISIGWLSDRNVGLTRYREAKNVTALFTCGASRLGFPEFGSVALVRPLPVSSPERRPSRSIRPRRQRGRQWSRRVESSRNDRPRRCYQDELARFGLGAMAPCNGGWYRR